MTALLEEAFRLARQLPESDQNAIAARILDEIKDEEEWQHQFAATRPALQRLSDEAWAEHERGETVPLDDPR